MNELVRTLQARITELEQRCARYENARYILCIERDHLRRKLGYNNTHPDADKCDCVECFTSQQPYKPASQSPPACGDTSTTASAIPSVQPA